ncbi:hypothetical protein [Planococcus dechangensis]|uniref:Uncharacterized protein n=1 Tax=Planococcus dechangensis TaxID=1176255 RepID=A0ABV9MFT2_9BACL
MKLLWQAAAGAAFIHGLYWMTAFLFAYVKTMMYQPNIEMLLGNEQVLQTEVAFVNTLSPLWYGASFMAVTLMLWGLMALFKKAASTPSW